MIEYEFLGFRDVHRQHQGHPTHWIALDFKVLVNPDTVKNNDPGKIVDLQWKTLETMPPFSQYHSQLENIIERYRDKLKP
ncbi:hypothetical protein HY933_04375 [Candidatus Falkowbacteria bacterium]|nr:hypothetical protein [Candidatus Falkowbacteria bacterium]